MNDNLTIDEKCMLINLAMAITTGKVDYKTIIEECEKDLDEWRKVFYFWAEFNDMTRQAINLICLEYNYLYN